VVKNKSRRAAQSSVLMAAALALGACNVETTDSSTGGVDGGPPGKCPAGVTVVLSDYVSTQIALSSLSGETQSASFLSTGSTKTDGLAFALSGDVIVPSSTPSSGSVVLLDRYGTNVISWADPKTAQVTAQLPVGTGFESNPQDYLEVSESIAFVTRYGDNSDKGKQPFDAGNDVLVEDRSDAKNPQIVESIPLPVVGGLPPRPGRMIRVGSQVIVPLERVSDDYATTGDAMFVGIDATARKILWQTTLKGLKNCGRPALSPDGGTLAVACSGSLDPNGNSVASESALVFFKAQEGELVETGRKTAKVLAGEAIQSRVAYATDETILFATQTAFGGPTNNRLLSLNLTTNVVAKLLEASPSDMGGKGLVYSSITCAPGCSDTCLMADSDKGVLQRIQIGDGKVDMLTPVKVENKVGLPPIGLGLR
jgi:hypothetical protein